MKNLRLTLIGKESFLFRILSRGKKLNSTTPDMLYGVKKRKISMLFSDVLKIFYSIFYAIFV